MSRRHVIALLLTFSSSLSWGTSDYQLLKEENRTEIIDRCLGKGFFRVHALQLWILKSRMSRLLFYEVDEVPAYLAEGRRSAYYRNYSIFIKKDIPKEMRPLLILHESLGALGYDDQNYESSVSLAILCNSPSYLAPRLVRQGFFEKLFGQHKFYRVAGGATVIGGGGDALAATLKYRVIWRLAQERFPADDIIYLLKVPVEPDPDYSNTTHLKIEPDDKTGTRYFIPRNLAFGTPEFALMEQTLYLRMKARSGR